MKYYCNNPKCPSNDTEPYSLNIASEAVLDEKNLATMFCPLCHGPLNEKASDLEEIHTSV